MASARVVISIDRDLLAEIDGLVAQQIFANRSQAVQSAVREEVARLRRAPLAEECAGLDPAAEKAMAEAGMAGELPQWPTY